MLSMGRFVRLFLAAVVTCALTGCWDETDINDRSPTVAVGFDLTPQGAYAVTLGNALGAPSSSQSPAGIAIGIEPRGEGRTFSQALAALHRTTTRSLTLEAVQVYILGSSLVEHGKAEEILDYLREANNVDPSAVLIAVDGSAHALLVHRDPIFESEGVRLVREFASTHSVSDGGMTEPVWDAERRTLDGLPFAVAEYQSTSTAAIRALGAMVIPPEGRPAILDPSEQDTLAWVMGRNDYAEVGLPSGEILRGIDVRAHSGWDPVLGEGTLKVSMTTAGYRLKRFVQSHAQTTRLEDEAARTVEARIQLLLAKLSSQGLDVLDLRERAREAGASFPGIRAARIALSVHVQVLPIPEEQPSP